VALGRDSGGGGPPLHCPAVPGAPTFDDALDAVAGVEGWMTDAQARRLWDRAAVPYPPALFV
jgi:hypothetical protein